MDGNLELSRGRLVAIASVSIFLGLASYVFGRYSDLVDADALMGADVKEAKVIAFKKTPSSGRRAGSCAVTFKVLDAQFEQGAFVGYESESYCDELERDGVGGEIEVYRLNDKDIRFGILTYLERRVSVGPERNVGFSIMFGLVMGTLIAPVYLGVYERVRRSVLRRGA